MAYSLHVTDSQLHRTYIPLFLHYCGLSERDVAKEYRLLETEDSSGIFPRLRKWHHRVARNTFLQCLPHDLEFRTLGKSLRPLQLAALTAQMLNTPVTSAVGTLLGYRPERRVVVRADITTDEGRERTVVIKFCRKTDAERIWQMSRQVGIALASMPEIAQPVGWSRESGALVFQYLEGKNLHDLVQAGTVCAEDFHRAGRLLRRLHDAAIANDLPVPSFGIREELAILERWRRVLKSAELELYRYVAKTSRLVEDRARLMVPRQALLHRDFYPKQVLVSPYTRELAIVDLDTLASGDPMLDVGNFLAHLALPGEVGEAEANQWRNAFLDGYGDYDPDALAVYELSSTMRLTCLASIGAARTEQEPALLLRTRRLLKRLQ